MVELNKLKCKMVHRNISSNLHYVNNVWLSCLLSLTMSREEWIGSRSRKAISL